MEMTFANGISNSSSFRITNYFITFFVTMLSGRLRVVNHYFHIDLQNFFLPIIFYHVIIMVKSCKKFYSARLFLWTPIRLMTRTTLLCLGIRP